jgi:hypothetical protein
MKQFQIDLGTKLDETLHSTNAEYIVEIFARGIAKALHKQLDQIGVNRLRALNHRLTENLLIVNESIRQIVEAEVKPDFTALATTKVYLLWQQKIVDKVGDRICARVDFTMTGMRVCYVIEFVFVDVKAQLLEDDEFETLDELVFPKDDEELEARRELEARWRWFRDAKANA